jgi:hypothetical protein
MKLTALCVTYDRPEFARWLIWNMEKQTRPADATIILASGGSSKADYSSDLLNPQVLRYKHQVLCSDARQQVMDRASGGMIVWYDDDDVYCKEKNAILERALMDSGLAAAALFPPLWWHLKKGLLELGTPRMRGRVHVPRRRRRRGKALLPTQPILPLYALRTEVAQQHRWPPGVHQGSDTTWMQDVQSVIGWKQTVLVRQEPAMFILVHNKNLYQTKREIRRKTFPVPEETQWESLPQAEWDEVKQRVLALEIP